MAAIGTFNAQSLQIAPQAIQLRIYVTDYLPNRPRVYSPTYTLYVLDVDQHAIWMTEQLNKWHRQALEVRDRELQLFETNKELRAYRRKNLMIQRRAIVLSSKLRLKEETGVVSRG